MLTANLKAKQLVGVALAVAALLLFPVASSAQAKKPITREGLVKAVRINGLSTSELILQVQSRGPPVVGDSTEPAPGLPDCASWSMRCCSSS